MLRIDGKKKTMICYVSGSEKEAVSKILCMCGYEFASGRRIPRKTSRICKPVFTRDNTPGCS